jgi:chaperone modulatory protein CbpM
MTFRQTTVTVVSCTPVDEQHPLRAAELAHAAGDRIEWVVELVEAGVIHPTLPEAPREQWAFHSEALQRALAARRLQRDFDVGVDAAALILDLQQEVRRLRALMGPRGLR